MWCLQFLEKSLLKWTWKMVKYLDSFTSPAQPILDISVGFFLFFFFLFFGSKLQS